MFFPRRKATGVHPSGGFARLPHCTPSVQGATPLTRWYPYFPDLRQTRPRFLTPGPGNAALVLKPTDLFAPHQDHVAGNVGRLSKAGCETWTVQENRPTSLVRGLN